MTGIPEATLKSADRWYTDHRVAYAFPHRTFSAARPAAIAPKGNVQLNTGVAIADPPTEATKNDQRYAAIVRRLASCLLAANGLAPVGSYPGPEAQVLRPIG
jgi:hypothetical protein